MLGVYYSKAMDSRKIFDGLNISKSEDYEEHLNKYNVISISFNRIPDKNKSYFTICDMLFCAKDRFIFIFDEVTFLKDRMFGEYFGFTENEVMRLCDKNGEMKFKELEDWYNGYLKIPNKELMKEWRIMCSNFGLSFC